MSYRVTTDWSYYDDDDTAEEEEYDTEENIKQFRQG